MLIASTMNLLTIFLVTPCLLDCTLIQLPHELSDLPWCSPKTWPVSKRYRCSKYWGKVYKGGSIYWVFYYVIEIFHKLLPLFYTTILWDHYPSLQMREQRLRDGEQHSQGQTASEAQSKLYASNAHALFSILTFQSLYLHLCFFSL